jgi:molecular chaperone GrpE
MENSTEDNKINELEKCKNQCEEYLNGWKRTKADLLNYQKDEAKRLEEVIKFANKDFLKDLIVVLDSFDLAINSLGEASDKGFMMIRSQLGDILKKHGLEQIKVEPGMAFDPEIHEALMEVPSGHPPGTIAEEIEKGYILNGRVVRPARVKISK